MFFPQSSPKNMLREKNGKREGGREGGKEGNGEGGKEREAN